MQNKKTKTHQAKSRVLTRYDREMATIRNQKFLAEYNKYLTLKNSNHIEKARGLEKKIIKKWNLADLNNLESIIGMRPSFMTSRKCATYKMLIAAMAKKREAEVKRVQVTDGVISFAPENEVFLFTPGNKVNRKRPYVRSKCVLNYAEFKHLQDILDGKKKVRIPIVLKPYFDYLEMVKKAYRGKITLVTDPTNLPPLDYYRVRKSEDNTEAIYHGEYALLIVPTTTQPIKRLKENFEQEIKLLIPKGKPGKKEYQYNPWIVHDLCTLYGWKPYQVAKKFCEDNKKSINYGSLLKAAHKAVERAYEAACEIIEQVGKEAESLNLP